MKQRLCQRALMAGMTPVEVLISVALALVLVLGASSALLGSRQTNRTERNLLAMQANGRIAMDLLAREVRRAGFRTDLTAEAVDVFPALTATANSSPVVTASFAAGAVFTAPGSSEVWVRYQGAGDSWGADCLGQTPAAARGDAVWQRMWLAGSQLQCWVGRPGVNTGAVLMNGIEALQLTYGVDTNADGYADEYRQASTVGDWTRVASVNVQLRVVSDEDNVADTPQPYVAFDGNVTTPADRRLRRTFATVIGLRAGAP